MSALKIKDSLGNWQEISAEQIETNKNNITDLTQSVDDLKSAINHIADSLDELEKIIKEKEEGDS